MSQLDTDTSFCRSV